eukprot:gene10584-7352_t
MLMLQRWGCISLNNFHCRSTPLLPSSIIVKHITNSSYTLLLLLLLSLKFKVGDERDREKGCQPNPAPPEDIVVKERQAFKEKKLIATGFVWEAINPLCAGRSDIHTYIHIYIYIYIYIYTRYTFSFVFVTGSQENALLKRRTPELLCLCATYLFIYLKKCCDTDTKQELLSNVSII